MTGGFKLLTSGLATIETKLGWTVFGKNPMPEISGNSTLLLNKEALISDLWSLDALGILDPPEKKNILELQEEARDHFLSTVKVNEEGRFQVSWPWLDNHLPLKDNHDLAVKRLDSMKGSPSLNDCLGKGLNLIELIPSILHRFRTNRTGVSAGADGESRRVRLKVQNGEVIRAVQNLDPLELSSTEELPSKFNQNCRCENISPEQTPFDDAPVKSDGTIPADIKLPTINKSGGTVRIPRRLDL
ncbi:hypothetical protein AVEN_251378-1 [Araneus ventricosus]|uniref:Peptidase aspartic putative domain-containing protein n=1 Tax=Araneus ventricosus TaxID=182803 RepID=A0A4Y2QZ94_ARAVE|nr:hypothetical protein AVEN_251378-1 [Araneus ventricosus]